MAAPNDSVSMALFCDFENVALGVRDANYEKFDIKKVLERLLLKGSIVVKKAYCDWERYKGFKAAMHEANFELIEIPHVRQSGKNSADIRLVVDALDLCYTKSHVDTFVIISGDSDFSPLVSKLRENAKQVIGVGVKQSTSDLLIANCDEFIFYDDLVREHQRTARKESREAQPVQKRPPEEEARRRQELDQRRSKAIELAVETFEALLAERGESGKIWASMLKEAIKRRNPGFNESYYGFRVFGNLLDEAQARGLLTVGRDEKSGAYVQRAVTDDSKGVEGVGQAEAVAAVVSVAAGDAAAVQREPASARKAPRRTRKGRGDGAGAAEPAPTNHAVVVAAGAIAHDTGGEAAQDVSQVGAPKAEQNADQKSRGARPRAVEDQRAGKSAEASAMSAPASETDTPSEEAGKVAKPASRRRGRSGGKAPSAAGTVEATVAAAEARGPAEPAPPAVASPAEDVAEAGGEAPRDTKTARRGGSRAGAGRRTGKRKPASAGE